MLTPIARDPRSAARDYAFVLLRDIRHANPSVPLLEVYRVFRDAYGRLERSRRRWAYVEFMEEDVNGIFNSYLRKSGMQTVGNNGKTDTADSSRGKDIHNTAARSLQETRRQPRALRNAPGPKLFEDAYEDGQR